MNLIFLRTVVSNKGQIGTNHKILYNQRLFCDRENASGYSGAQWVEIFSKEAISFLSKSTYGYFLNFHTVSA